MREPNKIRQEEVIGMINDFMKPLERPLVKQGIKRPCDHLKLFTRAQTGELCCRRCGAIWDKEKEEWGPPIKKEKAWISPRVKV